MNKKRKSTLIICCICALAISATAITLFDTKADRMETASATVPSFHIADHIDYSFEELVAMSNLVVHANLIESTDHGEFLCYDFAITSVIRGNADSEVITVYQYPDESDVIIEEDTAYIDWQTRYEKGKNYLLVLEKHSSVYYTDDKYFVLGNMVVPTDDLRKSTSYGDSLNLATNSVQALDSKITSITKTTPVATEYYGNSFTTETNIDKITQFSDCTFEVVVKELIFTGNEGATELYECEVVNSYQNDPIQDDVMIVFFSDTVEAGNRYLVNVNHVGDDSLMYTLAAKTNSVFPASDVQNITEVLDTAEQQKQSTFKEE